MEAGSEIAGERGRYRLEEQIGAGGMGRVWRATDLAAGDQVAVKTVLGAADLKRRFQREMSLLAKVSHRNVVAYRDAGAAGDEPFVVTAYIEGLPLCEAIAERALRHLKPIARRWAAELAAALAAVHARGIVHRDVKPSNVVVDPDDQLVLIDFGLAKTGEDSRLTKSNEILGTLSYMSPEAYALAPVTAASDVYGWGLVMYEVLTRHRPHPELDPMYALEERRQRAPDLAVKGDLESLARLVEECLAPDPTHRPKDGGELVRRLATLDGPPATTAEVLAPLVQALDLPDPVVPPLEPPPAPPGRPERVGAWDIVREIGRGGMGTVYEGRGRTSGERVAIKVTTQTKLDGPQRERFEREARILVALQSPHVVRVLDFGEDAGRPYIVMQFLDGEDLARRLERGPLSLTAALALMGPIAQGVADLHAKGVMHRDLKPSNVLVTAKGEPRLVDFGLARSAQDHRVTQAGDFIGTVGYAAPEVLGGKLATPSSDVYALGLMLFEMLSGTRDGRRLDARDRLRDVIAGDPALETPAGMVVRECLLDLVARAVQAEPRSRFADAGGFARALKQVQGDLARLARPAAAPAPAPAPAAPRTSPLTWALLALVVAGAVGLLRLLPEIMHRAGL